MDAPPHAPDAPPRRALAALAVALLAAAALRLHHLGALSFYYDELYAVRIHGLSLRNLAGVVARTAFYDIHPPLYYLACLAWTALLGVSEAAARGLSVAAGLATLPVVYLLGRDLHSRRTGAVAAAVLAVYSVHVYYSREARMYAAMALAASLSTWLLVRLARGDRQRWLLPAWLAATTATALTHYFGVMHVVAEFVIVAWRGRRGAASLPAWLALFAAPGAVFVPFALFAQYQTKHNEVSYLGRGLGAYADLFTWLGGGHQRLPFAPLWTLPLVALAALGARASWREHAPGWTPPTPPPPRPRRASGSSGCSPRSAPCSPRPACSRCATSSPTASPTSRWPAARSRPSPRSRAAPRPSGPSSAGSSGASSPSRSRPATASPRASRSASPARAMRPT